MCQNDIFYERADENALRLNLCDGLDWIELNFFKPTMVGWVKKSPQLYLTQPMHSPSCHKVNLI